MHSKRGNWGEEFGRDLKHNLRTFRGAFFGSASLPYNRLSAARNSSGTKLTCSQTLYGSVAWPSGQRVGLAVRRPCWICFRSSIVQILGHACKQPTGCLLPVVFFKSCFVVFESFVSKYLGGRGGGGGLITRLKKCFKTSYIAVRSNYFLNLIACLSFKTS